MSTNKKREGINRFACDVSLYDAEKPKASMKYHKPPLPMILLGIVAYGFVGQPFSKQLYSCKEILFIGNIVLNHGPIHRHRPVREDHRGGGGGGADHAYLSKGKVIAT